MRGADFSAKACAANRAAIGTVTHIACVPRPLSGSVSQRSALARTGGRRGFGVIVATRIVEFPSWSASYERRGIRVLDESAQVALTPPIADNETVVVSM